LAQARPRKRGAAPAKKRKRVQIPDDQIRYTNVDMLKRFLSERGKIRARRMTGLSRRQQALAAREIKRAREIGLLPYNLPKTDRPRGGGPREDRGDRGDRGPREERTERTPAPAAAERAA
jgi:small subunit ribosomal protein S18